MKKLIYVLVLASIAYFGYNKFYGSEKAETPKSDSTTTVSVDTSNTVKADTVKK